MAPNNFNERASNENLPNGASSEYVSDPRRYSDPDGNRELLRLRNEGLDPAALPLPENDPPRAAVAPARAVDELLLTQIRATLSAGKALKVETSGDALTIRISVVSLEDKQRAEAILAAITERDRESLSKLP